MVRWFRTIFPPVVVAVVLTILAIQGTRSPLKASAVLVSPPAPAPVKPVLSAPSSPATVPAPPSNRLCGAGIVEPCTENISVGTLVPGVVSQVLVKVGQSVPAAAPLYRIDDRQLRGTLKVREAALLCAEVDLARLEKMPRPESLPAAEAKVYEAKAMLAAQRDLFDRSAGLRPRHAIAEEEYVTRKQGYEAAQQQVHRLEAEYALLRAGAWEPDKAVARAAVARAKAEVEQTRIDLDRLMVRAPVSGQVLQINVRPGEFVSTPHPVSPIVLGDLVTLHVRVDIDGHDIPRFRPGLSAKATPRGHTQPEYPLEFVCVQPYVIMKRSYVNNSTSSSPWVDPRVLQVIYTLKGGGESLYVGQPLDVSIDLTNCGLVSGQKVPRS